MEARYDIEKLAVRISYQWSALPPGVSLAKTGSLCMIEAGLHELAHAAVIDIFHCPEPDVSERIDRVFRMFGNNRAADLSELRALAVERLVIHELGLATRIHMRWMVASALLRENWSWNARIETIERFESKIINQKRAKRVVGWVDELMRLPLDSSY